MYSEDRKHAKKIVLNELFDYYEYCLTYLRHCFLRSARIRGHGLGVGSTYTSFKYLMRMMAMVEGGLKQHSYFHGRLEELLVVEGAQCLVF